MKHFQASAKLKYVNIAPRKVRLVIDLIRGLKVEEALKELYYQDKRAANPIRKLLQSAVANAEFNHNLDKNSLIIKEIKADGGPVLKRFQPRARGVAYPIRKRTSHIFIALEGAIGIKERQKKAKKEGIADADQNQEIRGRDKRDKQERAISRFRAEKKDTLGAAKEKAGWRNKFFRRKSV